MAIDLISEAVSVKRKALSNDSELKEEGRSVWLVATQSLGRDLLLHGLVDAMSIQDGVTHGTRR